LTSLKWTDADFADYEQGKLPMGYAPDTWSYAMLMRVQECALVLDESFISRT